MKVSINKQFIITTINIITILLSFGANAQDNQLKNGDLIFVSEDNTSFSKAINHATNHLDQNYSHVGILQLSKTDTFVWHATPRHGVARQRYTTFMVENSSSSCYLYRIIKHKKIHYDRHFRAGRKLIGLPYNYSFIPNDTSYYCSEFVLKLMGNDLRYPLIPMNFKDLATGEMPGFWIDYYKKLQIEIPQGTLGSNPNDLSKSPLLKYITKIKRN